MRLYQLSPLALLLGAVMREMIEAPLLPCATLLGPPEHSFQVRGGGPMPRSGPWPWRWQILHVVTAKLAGRDSACYTRWYYVSAARVARRNYSKHGQHRSPCTSCHTGTFIKYFVHSTLASLSPRPLANHSSGYRAPTEHCTLCSAKPWTPATSRRRQLPAAWSL